MISLGIFASIWSTFISILLFLLVLSVVICIHELGHLFFAKRAGILCHEFSFGMGPKLWSTKKGETRYSIRAIPFGGYVSMAGEEIEDEVIKVGDEVGLLVDDSGKVIKILLNKEINRFSDVEWVTVEKVNLSNVSDLYINDYVVAKNAMFVSLKNEIQIAPNNRRFNGKSKTNRFLTTFGGPLMNFILAFVIYLIISFSSGVANLDSTVIGEVNEGAPAYGVLLPGDKVISINGVDVDRWSGDSHSIVSELELDLDGYLFEVEREGAVIEIETPVYPYLLFYGLGFAGDASESELIVYAPLFRNSELLSGDKVVSINGESMLTWQDLVDYQNSHHEGSSDANDTFEMTIYRKVVVSDRIDLESEDSAFVKAIHSTDNGVQLTLEVNDVEHIIQIDNDLTVMVNVGDTIDKTTVLASGTLHTSFLFYGEKELTAMGVSLFDSQIGISATTKFSFFGGVKNTFVLFWDAATAIFGTLGLLFTSKLVGVSDLSGFVGIYSMTSEAAAYGVLSLLSFVALLSVNLGILNLLPIPALDGGRIVFIGYEALTGRKPNQRFENILHTAVFFLLLALMIYVTYHDILRLFGLN